MRLLKFSYKLIFLFIITNTVLFAQSSVWKVSKGNNHIFIGGTVHALKQSDYPLPKVFDTAYNSTEVLVLEADITKIDDLKTQEKMMQETMYIGEKSLQDFLKPKTLARLKKVLKEQDLPIFLLKMKPGLLSTMLSIMALEKQALIDAITPGVDDFYYSKARNDKKKVNFLETVNEQITGISNIALGNEDAFIVYTLDELPKTEKSFKLIKNSWKTGNMAKLKKEALDTWKDKFPKVYQTIIVKRNNAWMPKIEAMFKTKEVELVLFGALHLVGKEGVLAQLKKLGYSIKNL